MCAVCLIIPALIFEISMDEFGSSVGGGGRYDEMVKKFTGQQVPACGFSIGFERIIMLLTERGYSVPDRPDKTAILIEKNMPEDKLADALFEAIKLRHEGRDVSVSNMKKNRKFQKDNLASEGYTDIKEYFNG